MAAKPRGPHKARIDNLLNETEALRQESFVYLEEIAQATDRHSERLQIIWDKFHTRPETLTLPARPFVT